MPPQTSSWPPVLDANGRPVPPALAALMVNNRPMSIEDYNATEQGASSTAAAPSAVTLLPDLDLSRATLQDRVKHVIETMRANGTPVHVASSYRDDAEQQRLYAQGRTAPGPIVTGLDGVTKRSRHQDALAVDFAFDGRDPNGEQHDWQQLGAVVRQAGLKWGGDFVDDTTGKPTPDRPHAQLPNPPTTGEPTTASPQPATSTMLRAGAPTGLVQPRQQTAAAPPPAAPASDRSQRRLDGSAKGDGYFGRLLRPDGSVSSEISIGVNIDGKEVQIPTLVPTLAPSDINWLMRNDISDPSRFPQSIIRKATDFARQRIAAGKSPFASVAESPRADASAEPYLIPGKTVPAWGRSPASLPPPSPTQSPGEAAAVKAAAQDPNRPPSLDEHGRPVIPTWASKLSPGLRETPVSVFGASLGRLGDVVDFAEGATAGVASTMYHSGDLVRRAIGAERTINSPEAQQRMHAPENFAGWLGNATEQGAEFLVPVAKINKATAGWNLAARIATDAAVGAGTTGLQTGGDTNAMEWGAALGALVPAGGAAFRAGQRTAAGYSAGGVRGGLAAFMRKAAPLEASVLATQALAPRTSATQFTQALDRALPEIKQSEQATGTITGLTKFREALKDAQARLTAMYEAYAGPKRAMHINLSSVADAMEQSIPGKTFLQDPEKAAGIIDRAATYRQPMTLERAEQFLHETNAQLDAFYAQNPGSRQAARMANPKIAYLEAEGDALRKAIYGHLDAPNQGAAVAELQKRRASLIEVREAAERQINQAIAQSGEVTSRGQVLSDAAQGAVRAGRGDLLGAWRSARYVQRGLREQETIDTLIKRAMAAHKGLPVPVPMPVIRPPAGLLGPGAHQMPQSSGPSPGMVGNTGAPTYPPVQGRTGLPSPSFHPMGPVPPGVRDAEIVSHVTTDARPPAGAVDAEILGHGPYQGELVDEAGNVIRPPKPAPPPITDAQIVKPKPKPEKVSRVDPRQGTLADVIEPSSTTSTVAATEAPRTHPLVSVHSDDPFAKIIRRAQDEGYQGDPAHLHAELESRLSLIKDQQDEALLHGQNPDILLRAIAKAGGISETAETGLKGEIKWLKEAQDTTTRKVKGKPSQRVTIGGQINGIKGVVSDRAGRSFDGILEYLRQDPIFKHITSINDLLEELRRAVATTPTGGQKAAFGELEQRLRSGWWQQVEHRQQVGTIGEALGDAVEDDIPF